MNKRNGRKTWGNTNFPSELFVIMHCIFATVLFRKKLPEIARNLWDRSHAILSIKSSGNYDYLSFREGSMFTLFAQ